MTRINSAIPVKCLTDEHLLAEHREIKRLPFNLKESIRSDSIRKIPKTFTLGKGHILFFLDKMKYIYERYIEIYKECEKRGFNVISYHENWKYIDIKYWNDYKPTSEERLLLFERISQRLKESCKKCWHYNKKEISKEQAIKLLQECFNQ